MNKQRASGILLHITSLPSRFGIGDLGPEAYKFADFLVSSKQKYWQILPLNPPCPSKDNSPYSAISAFAGNPLLISPELLVKEEFLKKGEIRRLPDFPAGKVNYRQVSQYKNRLLNLAYKNFVKIAAAGAEYEKFCHENKNWLEDFAMFAALGEYFNGRSWCNWPKGIRDRNSQALEEFAKKAAGKIQKYKFFQYIFFKQWSSLKKYCNGRGIKIVGDIPMYVAYESADVWANPEIFKLTKTKKPESVAGVPPDYYSKTGQLWDTPVYRWDVLKRSGYQWWLQRFEHNLKLFDMVRLDHFRGLVAYWEVPAGNRTAAHGRWVRGPGESFIKVLTKRFHQLPLIAEDLGFITPPVRRLVEKVGFPGMRVLLFGFRGGYRNPHLPHNYIENCVAYTGTHDNNTICGWFDTEASLRQKKFLFDYIDEKINGVKIHWELIGLALDSAARLVIIPLQDILGLGQSARMNCPSGKGDNWVWRVSGGCFKSELSAKLSWFSRRYKRT